MNYFFQKLFLVLSNFEDCVLPELLGKWHASKETSTVMQVTWEQSIEENSGIWYVWAYSKTRNSRLKI